MQNEQIVYFQTLDMGWVISQQVLDYIDTGNFSLRNLNEVRINLDGQAGRDNGPASDMGFP